MENSPFRSSKRRSTKDVPPTAIELLLAEDERINPAILLADRLMRRDAGDLLAPQEIEEAEAVLRHSREEIETVERQLAGLVRMGPVASTYVPAGF